MSIAPSSTTVPSGGAIRSIPAVLRQRASDYAELCRPRIALMTMISVAVGFTVASPIVFGLVTLMTTLLGVVMLVAASSILNQCLERRTDRAMGRTASRPIAAGRLPIIEAASVAVILTCVGTVLLWNAVNPAAAIATLSTLLTYVGGYTLLKPKTSLCTTIGAIPGAMPPVIGWLAADGPVGLEALSLFGLFFFWQFPHFLAIGWIHRRDYEKAGLRMLPSFTDGGFTTGLVALIYALGFVPIAVMPAYLGMTGDLYQLIALGLALCYLYHTTVFFWRRNDHNARRLLYVSLCCLPLLLITLVLDFLRLTSVG
ncbi:MAG: heme o synthase [Planctomycetaceae bacterium]|nr:heme o synthase [Planctomycetaceae bacterium]